jgi:mannose-1-phosphate guanylyltransferase
MAGGIGSRFWPWSKPEHPKQFLDILGTGSTLIQQTYHRLLPSIPRENFYIVTNAKYKSLVESQLPEIAPEQILCEPAMRNTAPCIAYASYKIKDLNPKAKVIVTPSDQIILQQEQFLNCVEQGFSACETNSVVTIGIQPTRPDTGYGYINYQDNPDHNSSNPVIEFKEKPNLEIAQSYLKSGNYVWNAGIFIFPVQHIISEFESYLPNMANLFSSAPYNSSDEVEFINSNFEKAENISIDYGIMEKSQHVRTLIGDFGWSDLGTWGSVYDNLKKDDNENAYVGNQPLFSESKRNMVKSTGKRNVVLQGVSDLVVVDTDDVIMVCNKSDEQKIKQLTKKYLER